MAAQPSRQGKSYVMVGSSAWRQDQDHRDFRWHQLLFWCHGEPKNTVSIQSIDHH